MAKGVEKERAKIQQILLYYNEPEILLLKKSAIEYIVAVGAVDDEDESVFIGASMTLRQLTEYQEGKFDLRFLLSHANLRRYWKFSYNEVDVEVELSRVTRGSDAVAAALPDSGFFSRSHEDIDIVKLQVADADERFEIDGSWDLGEFSTLYGQIEDVYYILTDIRRYSNPSSSQKEKNQITSAFERPWRGGGSYVGFYDNIANDNLPVARLKVSGIQYNSPGFVKLKAKRESFDSMIALLQAYSHEPKLTRKSYIALYKFLSFGGFLKAPADTVISSVNDEEITKLAKGLESYMTGVSFDTLYEMSGKNTLVAAKVLMSVYRRVEKLFRFFEEGRVSYEGLDVDPLLDTER